MASGICCIEGPLDWTGTISICKLAISEMNIIVIGIVRILLFSARQKCQSSSTGMQPVNEIHTLDLLDVCLQ
jgi:hypothetical protein